MLHGKIAVGHETRSNGFERTCENKLYRFSSKEAYIFFLFPFICACGKNMFCASICSEKKNLYNYYAQTTSTEFDFLICILSINLNHI